MKALERKISKMKVLNDDATTKLYVAEMLWKNKDLSLDNAITATSTAIRQNTLEKFSIYRLSSLYRKAIKIADILDIFDDDKFKTIYARKKANFSTNDFLEKHLKDVEDQIANDYYGIFQDIKEMRKNVSVENADFYKIFTDIEKSYKTILNIVKRIINKWYKFITAKSLIISLVVLSIVSLVSFFIINADFHMNLTKQIFLTLKKLPISTLEKI